MSDDQDSDIRYAKIMQIYLVHNESEPVKSQSYKQYMSTIRTTANEGSLPKTNTSQRQYRYLEEGFRMR